jgi:hypothetical protein
MFLVIVFFLRTGGDEQMAKDGIAVLRSAQSEAATMVNKKEEGYSLSSSSCFVVFSLWKFLM